MGCDIHVYLEKFNGEAWEHIPHDFDCDGIQNRDYRVFGFLAGDGPRNYSGTIPIAKQRGLPVNLSRGVQIEADGWRWDAHSYSWLTLSELTSFDYERMTEDRRCTQGNDGGCTCDPGQGEEMTYRQFLGEHFFKAIEELRQLGAERIVFWFDN